MPARRIYLTVRNAVMETMPFAGSAFEDRDDGVEREADGPEACQYACRDEKFGVEEGLFVEERREEQARQSRQHGDDRDAVGQREIGVPDLRQQDHLA